MTASPERILVADDNPESLRMMFDTLTGMGYEVNVANNGKEALASVNSEPPDMVLLDIHMPEMDGYQVCEAMKRDERFRDIPVIFVSALHEEFNKVKAFELGGVDYLTKPVQFEEAKSRITTHLGLRQMQILLEEKNAQLKKYQEHLEDLVDQKTVEVRQGRDRISAILQSVPNGLLVLDMQGVVTHSNEAIQKILGQNEEDLLQRQLRDTIRDEDFQRVVASVLETGQSAESAELDLPDRESGENRNFLLGTAMVRSEGGENTGVIVLLQDVTRERESQRLKNEFISTAAHELNTPLTSIMGYSEILQTLQTEGLLGEEEEVPQFLEIILHKGAHLSGIIEDLLQVSRMESHRPLVLDRSRFSLGEVLEEMVQKFSQESDKHRFELSMPDQPVEAEIDKGRFRQALENLIGNSVKYSPGGGAVRITLTEDSRGIKVAVEDEGIGMTAEQLERVCEKFYRVDASSTAVCGFGLGLTIIKCIVQAHGGTLTLESEPGRGTKATIFFSKN